MKRFIALMLAILCTFASVQVVSALEYGEDIKPEADTNTQTFADVPTNHWAFEYIADLVTRGAINGYPDGKYYPDYTVSRAEFAKIMVMAAGITPNRVNATGYADVSSTYWGAPYIACAKPYMTAYQQSNGQLLFRPDNAVLREDVAVAVVKLKGYDTSVADVGALKTMFSDYEGVSASIRPYIAVAVAQGIISGYSDGTFRGQNTVTRSEIAAILWRAFQMGSGDKVVPDETTPPEKPNQPENPLPPETPTQPQPPKSKYQLQTLATLPKNADKYIFTETGDLYYLKDNQLVKQSGGSTTVLFDGSADFYEEVTVAEMIQRVKDGPGDVRWGDMDIDALDDPFYAGDTEALLYYDTLSLYGLGYDQKNDIVYVAAASNFDNMTQMAYYSQKIYNVSNMTKPVFSITNTALSAILGDNGVPKPELICMRDAIFYDTYKINPASGSYTAWPEKTFSTKYYTYFQIGTDLYEAAYGGISKFDLASNTWKSFNMVDNTLTSATAICSSTDKIYFATGEGMYTLIPAGTNRLKSSAVFSWDTLNVTDGIPMRGVDRLLIDGSGNFIFADETAGALRKISVGS